MFLGVKSGTAWDSSEIPSFITAPLPDLTTPYFATQYGGDNYCIQTVANNLVVMQREIINGAVGSWKRTDNFGCSTPADLASLLGALKRGRLDSVDLNAVGEGFYTYNDNCTNIPSAGQGYLLMLKTNNQSTNDSALQMAFVSGTLYERVKWSVNSSWAAWKSVPLT